MSGGCANVKTYVLNNTCVNFSRQNICEENVFKHIGVYFFKDEIINEIKSLKQTKREEKEKLEQLRWLQNNYKIYFRWKKFLSQTRKKYKIKNNHN